ncbi:hypothetical protein ABT039_17475 [Streptomyces lasiicapitis]|uniref:Transmembrane protein n=1 Tax=Streptomyces lasiicapitis TaxID=1923961 RepID=A0ABQ2LQD2_9ACTN|nr:MULTISPECIES: hypothetical protein [Streptomyces]QIB47473.1 hypothetical protein G3H79_34725 [Streptomyces aureoverticillatus]GGO41749.1 hypothetical protein GCM10012286_22040 [Streptomyces lasiicapitis]
MPCRVPWWGLRRSPLRRRSDVIEAWAVLVVGVILFAGAPAAGIVVGAIAHVDGVAAARAERADRHRVTAVLTADAPPVVPDVDSSVPLHQVPARWTAPDGAAHTGDAQAPAGSRRGDRVAVWLDQHGQVTDDPLDADDVALRVFGASAVAAAGTALAALIALRTVRAILDKRRMAAWDDEWQKTGPEWGSRKS